MLDSLGLSMADLIEIAGRIGKKRDENRGQKIVKRYLEMLSKAAVLDRSSIGLFYSVDYHDAAPERRYPNLVAGELSRLYGLEDTAADPTRDKSGREFILVSIPLTPAYVERIIFRENLSSTPSPLFGGRPLDLNASVLLAEIRVAFPSYVLIGREELPRGWQFDGQAREFPEPEAGSKGFELFDPTGSDPVSMRDALELWREVQSEPLPAGF